jgi:uncharacterized protein YlxW (UPF0749 family)
MADSTPTAEENPAPRSASRPIVRVAIAALCALLGFAVVAQARSTAEDPLAGARTTDLVRILGDLDSQGDRLRAEIADLQQAQRELADGTDAAALAQAQRRSEVLGILAGTVPATGPGIEVELAGPDLSGITLLDAVQELRDAGAEVIEVGGVRVVASSSFATGPAGGIVVDGTTIDTPVLIRAIGDPATLEAALRIPGGLADTVASDGGTIRIEARDTVRIVAVVTPTAPQFAVPQTP